jgi:hypothetical protein
MQIRLLLQQTANPLRLLSFISSFSLEGRQTQSIASAVVQPVPAKHRWTTVNLHNNIYLQPSPIRMGICTPSRGIGTFEPLYEREVDSFD